MLKAIAFNNFLFSDLFSKIIKNMRKDLEAKEKGINSNNIINFD